MRTIWQSVVVSILANCTYQTSDEGFKLFISADTGQSLQLSAGMEDKGAWGRVMV